MLAMPTTNKLATINNDKQQKAKRRIDGGIFGQHPGTKGSPCQCHTAIHAQATRHDADQGHQTE